METLITIFREVRDPRDFNAQHDLAAMLFVALAATLCGAKSCVDIADFVAANESEMAEIVDLRHGPPSHDSFSRLFRLLDPEEVAKAFARFIAALREGLSNVVQFGVRAEEKPRLFVAMPFADDFIDEFEIGFHEAAKASAFICERLDLEAFTSDIVEEIRNRIVESHGVIALLNGHNPNVLLEIGFAWAHGKPTILVAKENVRLPFDVSAHRCIRYRNISQLRELLTSEIARLCPSSLCGHSGRFYSF
jgi:hypothetical protein